MNIGFQAGAFQVPAFESTGIPPIQPSPCFIVALPIRNLTATYVCCNFGDEAMRLQFFSALAPGEQNVLTFNFANGLENGATLTGTPTVAISTFAGNDPDPSAIQNGLATFDPTSTMVVVPVSVSLSGVSYLIDVTCPTTNPDVKLGMPAVLPVSFWE